jgi:NAD(P)-dependent dehydrogenase (short-subunit alcohol dehydrogenase family)
MLQSQLPWPHLGTPPENAMKAALVLAGDAAASWMAGAFISVDGRIFLLRSWDECIDLSSSRELGGVGSVK